MEDKLLVGVDLGGTSIKLAVLDWEGRILLQWEVLTDKEHEGRDIPVQIAQSIHNKLEETGLEKNRIVGIGVGAPGPADPETGVISEAVNLGWKSAFPLGSILMETLSLPVLVDNDANCAALGEMWRGAGKGALDLVCVTLGTGVGGGVITGGKIVHGKGGAAGEIGHIISLPDGGAPCNCGKNGCLETIASATGVVRLAHELLLKNDQVCELSEIFEDRGFVTAKDVFDAARNKDALAAIVVEKVSFHLGIALANIANTLNPDKIVIGGGVSRAGDILFAPLRDHFTRYAFPRVARSTALSPAMLGNDAGVIGAGMLIREQLSNL
ncbi:ROK family glucokinase [Bacillus massilinigeriensis]|uniref:ROK family glucokinase n=1 Tax=Bacillus mediterraneensis TaxID=1805474 RepID=UPI0008F8B67B|nr:ROK family glucokinase [Bacillus mediterraneensis]